MFLFNYRYRLKCIFNDRQLMFWTFLFPVLLATLFNLAFSNLSSAEEFMKVNVAVVQSQELDQNPAFIEAINGDDDLFVVQYTTKDEADALLNDNQIDGYIVFDPELNLVVNQSGLDQTIIGEFLDDFLQSSATITTIITTNPTAQTYITYMPELSQAELTQYLDKDLAEQSQVTMISNGSHSANAEKSGYYFNYLSYSMFAILILGVCSVMLVFNNTNLKRRNLCSPIR